jgi:hypothetical protein
VARKTDVASKKDLVAIQAKVAKLEGNPSSGGGQMLMTRPQESTGAQTMEEQFIAMQQELARTQAQLHHVTQQTLLHQERFEDLERTPPPPGSQAHLLSRQGMLPPPRASRAASMGSEHDEATAEAKRTLFRR